MLTRSSTSPWPIRHAIPMRFVQVVPLPSDSGRFSLDSLLNAKRIEDLVDQRRRALPPTPADVWEELRREWVEWPPLLSMKFPHLRLWDERIMRLADGCEISGLEPSVRPGSCVLLEEVPAIPDTRRESIQDRLVAAALHASQRGEALLRLSGGRGRPLCPALRSRRRSEDHVSLGRTPLSAPCRRHCRAGVDDSIDIDRGTAARSLNVRVVYLRMPLEASLTSVNTTAMSKFGQNDESAL